MVLAPAGHQDLDQVDLQQPGRGHGGLADGGFPGHPGQVHKRPGEGAAVRHDVLGQRLLRLLIRAEEQVGGGEHAVRTGRRHTPISSSVVMMAAGRGSRRTVYVSSMKTSWCSVSWCSAPG